MTARLPLVLGSNGLPEQLQSGDTLAGVAGAAFGLTSVSAMQFGAFADGFSHPLSSIYGSLAAAQAVYPWVDDLTPEADYCAIQTAIDYAFNNALKCIVIPHGMVRGTYITSAPVFLDPPVSLRAQGIYPRYNSVTAYPTPGTIIQYNGLPFISKIPVPAGNPPFFAKSNYPSIGTTPGSIYWAFYYQNLPGVSNTHGGALGQIVGWSPTLIGELGQADTAGYGSYIVPHFIDAPGLIMGTNNGGTASDFNVFFLNVVDPNSGSTTNGQGYEGGQNPYGVGIAIAGISGGSSRTTVRNIGVSNTYLGFNFGALGTELGDSNVLDRCATFNVFCGSYYSQSQAYINEQYNCNLSATVGTCTVTNATIFGGNYGAFFEQAPGNVFTIGSTSNIAVTQPGGVSYRFGQAVFSDDPGQNILKITTTVSSPDATLLTLGIGDGRAGGYNTFVIPTTNWGLVPFILDPAVNPPLTGGVLLLMAWPPWMDFFTGNGGFTPITSTAIQAELQAATKMYACQMVFPTQGSITAYGMFVENICATCLNSAQDPRQPSLISGLFNDADITLNSFQNSTPTFQANYYIQKAFPYIICNNDVVMDTCDWNASAGDCVVIDCVGAGGRLINRDSKLQDSYQVPMMNFRWGNFNGPFHDAFQTKRNSIQGNYLGSVGFNLPFWSLGITPNRLFQDQYSVPSQGFGPANWVVPSIPPSYLPTIANPRGLPPLTLTTCDYPVIWGSKVYQTASQSTPGNSTFESNHSFNSLLQDITAAGMSTATNVFQLSWRGQGGSPYVYVDPNTIGLMFAGLVVGLTTDALHWYIVTGVYPNQGCITIFQVDGSQDQYVQGVSGTIYTGTVMQAQPYRVRALAAPAKYINSTTVAMAGQELLADTSGGVVFLTLPLYPMQGDVVTWDDISGSFATHNLIIDGNRAQVNGSYDSIKITTSAPGKAICKTGSAALSTDNSTAAWVVTGGSLSAIPSLKVSPDTPATVSGHSGGTFSPATVVYALSASSGTVNWTVTGTPAWLSPSSTSGNVNTGGTAITFTVNVGALAVGTYTATLTFTNTDSGQVTTRNVSLGVGYGLVYAAEGDSITIGAGAASGYPSIYGTAVGPTLFVNDIATSGAGWAQISPRSPILDAMIATKKTGDKYALSVMIGTNDATFGYPTYGNANRNAFLTSLAAYLDARRASGWYVIICTLISRGGNGSGTGITTIDPELTALNTEFKLWTTSGSVVPGQHADAVCDFAAAGAPANGHFTPQGSGPPYANLTYYNADQTHPTTTGQNLLETIIAPVLNAYL